MENISKALIISGSIFVTILVISIGVMLIQSTQNLNQGMSETMDSTKIQQFNGKFDPYIGNHQNSATVKGLLSVIIASNVSSEHKIKVKTDGYIGNSIIISDATDSNEKISSLASEILRDKNYIIIISDSKNPLDGYYDLVIIKEK